MFAGESTWKLSVKNTYSLCIKKYKIKLTVYKKKLAGEFIFYFILFVSDILFIKFNLNTSCLLISDNNWNKIKQFKRKTDFLIFDYQNTYLKEKKYIYKNENMIVLKHLLLCRLHKYCIIWKFNYKNNKMLTLI